MLGLLPTTLDIQGEPYKIRSDYRNILEIFEAYNDPELSDSEKVYVCLNRIFVDFQSIPHDAYQGAYRAATSFLECNMHDDKPGPRLVNWNKDEQLIFPAINKVAGNEVRTLPYLHWWTFLGYFQSINHDDLWGSILSIRQKKAKGKKLEKYEQEFYRSNRDICSVADRAASKTAEDALAEMFNQLTGGED